MPRINLHVCGYINGANVTKIVRDGKYVDVTNWTSEEVVAALDNDASVEFSHILDDYDDDEIVLQDFEVPEN